MKCKIKESIFKVIYQSHEELLTVKVIILLMVVETIEVADNIRKCYCFKSVSRLCTYNADGHF